MREGLAFELLPAGRSSGRGEAEVGGEGGGYVAYAHGSPAVPPLLPIAARVIRSSQMTRRFSPLT